MPRKRTKRIFKKLLLVAAGLLVALVLLATGYVLFGPWYAAELEIGPETTVVEGPLREDGTVDYVAAMNEMAGQGMPAEDNAFAVIAGLIEPDEWGYSAEEAERTRRRTFELLGVEMPGDDANYFVPMRTYAEQQADRDDRWADPDDSEEPVAWQQQWERAREKPWSPDELPLVAEWLAEQEAALAKLSEGVRRQNYWSPYVTAEDDDLLISILLPTLQAQRAMATALRARAMRRLTKDDLDGASEDLLTLKRFGWHQRHTLTLIEQLVGIGIASLAADVVARLVAHESFAAEQARHIKARLAEGEGRFAMHRAFDIGERFVMLDGLRAIDHAPMESLFHMNLSPEQMLAYVEEASDNGGRQVKAEPAWLLNPNRAMRRGNAYFDSLVEAASAQTHHQRVEGLGEISREAEQRTEELVKHIPRSVWRVVVGGTDALTDQLTDLMLDIMVPALDRAVTLADRAEMLELLERVALAVGGYRAEHGEYPASLDDLVPEWMDTVPADIFDEAEQPVRYAVEDNRVVVYSVGPNGKDNGGLDGHGRWDEGDLVIQWSR